jgi:hypothetical protein
VPSYQRLRPCYRSSAISFNGPLFRRRSAKKLAEVSARLCRLLRDEVVEQMELGSPGLTALATDWRRMCFRRPLPAWTTILDVIGDLLADVCQVEEFLLDESIFGLLGKLPIHRRLLSKILIPVHDSSANKSLVEHSGRRDLGPEVTRPPNRGRP